MHDDDKSTYTIEAKYNYDEGVVEINIPDLIAQLDDEERKFLAQLHAFDSAIWEEIKRCLRNGFSTKNYNSYIHKLRIELLAGDGANKILKATMRGILTDLNNAEHRMKFYRDHYWKLQRWCRDKRLADMPKEAKYEYPPSVKNSDIEEAIDKAQK